MPDLRRKLGYHSFEPIGRFGLFIRRVCPRAGGQEVGRRGSALLRCRRDGTHRSTRRYDAEPPDDAKFVRIVRSDAQVYAKIIKDAQITID